MKILWGSPLPPIRSGVSDYAVELLAELGRRARVRVLRPPQWSEPDSWPLDGVVELVDGESEPEAGEISLVHLGNNPHHEWLLGRLDRPDTVVVLHDLVLHHLVVESTLAKGRSADFEYHLRRAHGEAGAVLARARSLGVSGRRDAFLFPARRGVLADPPAAFVVHSHWARLAVEREFPSVPCGRMDLPAADPGALDRAEIRARLGAGADDLVLMHVGFLTPEKGMNVILAGVASAVAAGVRARLLLVGEGRGLEDVRGAAEAAGIGDRVDTVGWLEKQDFIAAPAAADLGVVMRTPSAGESSAAGVRFLACGTPVAVGGLRQFLEWPERSAPRLTPGPSAAADLARLLWAAAADPAAWRARRAAAREIYRTRHRSDVCASALVDFLGRVKSAEGGPSPRH